MDENNDFFEKNKRFSRLIEHYARKLKDPHSAGELWGFLWILQATSFLPNDRYIAVCLRNKYIALAKAEGRTATIKPEIFEKIEAPESFSEAKLDLKEALQELTETQREAVVKQVVLGYTAESAANGKRSVQASAQNKRAGLLNLRNSVKLCGYERLKSTRLRNR